jgi:hypothetical protein
MIDEFVAKKGVESSLQWNIHSWNPFDADELNKRFTLTRDHATVTGTFLCQSNAFFSQTEGWDPSPMARKDWAGEWPQQYHLRFTPVGLEPARNLGVVLATSHRHLAQAEVVAGVDGEVETARIGEDDLRIYPPGADHIAELVVEGVTYRIDDDGIQTSDE